MIERQFESYIALVGGMVDEIEVHELATKCEFTVRSFKVTILVENDCTFKDFKIMTVEAINQLVSAKSYDYGRAAQQRDEIVQQLGLKPVKRNLWRALWK